MSKKNRETEKHHEGLVFWWCFSFAEKEYFFSFYLTKAEALAFTASDIDTVKSKVEENISDSRKGGDGSR